MDIVEIYPHSVNKLTVELIDKIEPIIINKFKQVASHIKINMFDLGSFAGENYVEIHLRFNKVVVCTYRNGSSKDVYLVRKQKNSPLYLFRAIKEQDFDYCFNECIIELINRYLKSKKIKS